MPQVFPFFTNEALCLDFLTYYTSFFLYRTREKKKLKYWNQIHWKNECFGDDDKPEEKKLNAKPSKKYTVRNK